MDPNRPKGRGRGRGASSTPAAPAGPQPDEFLAGRVESLQIEEPPCEVQHAKLDEVTAPPIRPAGRGRGARAHVAAPSFAPAAAVPTEPLRGSPPLIETSAEPPTESRGEPDIGPDTGKTTLEDKGALEESIAAAEDAATTGSGAPGSAAKGSDGFTDIQMRPKEDQLPVIKMGDLGTKKNFSANFFRVRMEENKGIFEYRIDFEPSLEDKRARKQALRLCNDALGPPEARNFDGGSILWLAHCLERQITEITVAHPNDADQNVLIRLSYVKKKEMNDCVQFYNVLLRRIQYMLGLKEMSRNFYDPRATHEIPQHKLEIWPGYVTRIDEVEGGLMLCLDASFRVLRTNTVLEIYNQVRKSPGDWQKRFSEYLLNKIVMTRYNHTCYKIDDIAWGVNPKTTFTRTRKGESTEMSFQKYYQEQYGLEISDLSQPLLVSKPKPRRNDKPGEIRLITLIPEFCYMSGLSDEQVSNFTVMKDVATYTRVTPQQRVVTLEKYMKNVKDHPDVVNLLNHWGLTFEDIIVPLEGRVLNGPTIDINDRVKLKDCKADFSRESTSNHCYEPIGVRKYVVISTKQDKAIAETMIKTYSQVCGPLGIKAGAPGEVFTIDRMNVADLRKILREVADPKGVQFVIVLLPMARDELYAAVKSHCLVERPIPSQVIQTKTLRNEKRVRSVMQKVALQINAKLGGALWALGIPVTAKIMFVGIDAYHDPKRKGPSVHALVATMDTRCTKYFSKVVYQKPKEELAANAIQSIFCLALQEFVKKNQGQKPDRIIVFRDGVSDGQWGHVKDTEVMQLKQGIKFIFPEDGDNINFTFVVVQKKINERFFLSKGGGRFDNPEPGSILDHSINRKYHFDFFLVSQLVRQGTVSPTHFVVLEDNSDIKPNLIQRFAYATTFMYFNWPGTIRVPAMCQYAHKLAYLAGQHLKEDPHTDMDEKLYYL